MLLKSKAFFTEAVCDDATIAMATVNKIPNLVIETIAIPPPRKHTQLGFNQVENDQVASVFCFCRGNKISMATTFI